MAGATDKMLYFIVKVVVTAALVAVVSEVARRSTYLGALLASLPLVSILAMIWMYREKGDVTKIAEFSTGVFWLVLPSLVLFLVLPLLLKRQVGFGMSLSIACAATIASYFAMVLVLWKGFGMKLL